MLGSRLGDLEPEGAGLDARALRYRVDRDGAHPLGLEQDRGAVPLEGCCAVTRALRGDAKVVLLRELDRGDHVCCRLGVHDRGGALVGGEVPGQSRGLPGGIGREDGALSDAGAQSPHIRTGERALLGVGVHIAPFQW